VSENRPPNATESKPANDSENGEPVKVIYIPMMNDVVMRGGLGTGWDGAVR
jgi:hypothetical protein